VRSLSPLATLERGYAVLQDADGHVVTSTDQTSPEQELQVRVSDGRIHVIVAKTDTDLSGAHGATAQSAPDSPGRDEEEKQ
jgi:exonuclease VII large subunit